MLLAETLATTDPECKHERHGHADHVCHDVKTVKVIDEHLIKAKVRKMARRNARIKAAASSMATTVAPTMAEADPGPFPI